MKEAEQEATYKKWRELQALVHDSEMQALKILKHPGTIPDQLVKLHALVSRQAVEIANTRRELRKKFHDTWRRTW
jgi:hypothetical protein